MRIEVSPYAECNGLSVRFDLYLNQWSTYAGCQLKKLPFKRDLRYWNAGPTSMQPKGCFAAIRWNRHDGDECIGVYEIWERQDGCGMKVFKFDDMADYEAYNPSQESPDAIKREIGLCANYHAGI